MRWRKKMSTHSSNDHELDEITRSNLDCIRDDIFKRNFDFFAIVLAREGDGKSTFAMECAIYIDPNFTVDQMIMTDADWWKIKPKLRKGMALVFDEGSEVAFSRDAMKRDVKNFMKELTQIRGMGLFMLFCISDIKNADRFIRERRAFALFYIPSRSNMWCYRLFGKNPRDEKNVTDIKKALLNGEFPTPHYRNHFKALKTPLWNDYISKKKMPFMKKERESKLVRKMREKLEKKMEGSVNVYELKKIYGVTDKTIYKYIKFLPVKYRFKDIHGRIRITKEGLRILPKKLQRYLKGKRLL